MEILLWRTVDKLGDRGEVVDVAPGYARNYLFRKGWATPPTPEHRQKLGQEEERLKKEEQKRIESNRKKLDLLKSIFLVIQVECNEDGQLYGSVTSKILAEEIEEKHGIECSPRQIELKHPIKQVGTYNVLLRLHPEVQGEMYTWVIQRGEEEA